VHLTSRSQTVVHLDPSCTLLSFYDRALTFLFSQIKNDRDTITPLLTSGRIQAIRDAASRNQEIFDALERSLRTYSSLGPGMSWP